MLVILQGNRHLAFATRSRVVFRLRVLTTSFGQTERNGRGKLRVILVMSIHGPHGGHFGILVIIIIVTYGIIIAFGLEGIARPFG